MRGLITAIVTPLTENQQVDYASLTRLINYQIDNGATGLVLLGSTGEAIMLSHKEKLAIINHSIEIIAKRAAVIVGVTPVGTNDALQWIKSLNEITGINYILAVTPAYVKAPQRGLYEHFITLADASKTPIILYNVPGRTASDLADDTTLHLAQTNIVGIKDATGDIARCCYLVKHRPENFLLYSGDDATSLAFVLCGGDGAISVTGNVAPKIMSSMLKHALAGDTPAAIQENHKILELHQLLFIASNPIPVKWALYDLKIITSPQVLPPLSILDTQQQHILQHALNRVIKSQINAVITNVNGD